MRIFGLERLSSLVSSTTALFRRRAGEPPDDFRSTVSDLLIYGPATDDRERITTLSPKQLHVIDQMALGKTWENIRGSSYTDWDGTTQTVSRSNQERGKLLYEIRSTLDLDENCNETHIVATVIWLAQNYRNAR